MTFLISMVPVVDRKMVVFTDSEGKNIKHVIGPYKYGRVYVSSLTGIDGSSFGSRLFGIEVNDGEEESGFIFDAGLNNLLPYNGSEIDSFAIIAGGKIVFIRRQDSRTHYIIYDTNTGEHKEWKEGDPILTTFNYGTGTSFVDEKNNSQTIYERDLGLRGVKVPTKKIIYSVHGQNGEEIHDGMAMSLLFDSGGNEKYERQIICNAMIVGKDGFIFGIFGEHVSLYGDVVELRYWDAGRKRFRSIRYEEGEYTTDDLNGGFVKCDNCGRTEQDIISDKNLKAWQEKGGYSPEVKAQMDKMWNDRENDDYDYQKKLGDWDDADLEKDTLASDFDFGDPSNHSSLWNRNDTLKSIGAPDTSDGKRWRGPVGDKDPMAPFSRKGQFYRIGVDGKPLDQPWYDEDEIPARVSDRVIRENISLMDRMGLFD